VLLADVLVPNVLLDDALLEAVLLPLVAAELLEGLVLELPASPCGAVVLLLEHAYVAAGAIANAIAPARLRLNMMSS
jgi:hypothetical protein